MTYVNNFDVQLFTHIRRTEGYSTMTDIRHDGHISGVQTGVCLTVRDCLVSVDEFDVVYALCPSNCSTDVFDGYINGLTTVPFADGSVTSKT